MFLFYIFSPAILQTTLPFLLWQLQDSIGIIIFVLVVAARGHDLGQGHVADLGAGIPVQGQEVAVEAEASHHEEVQLDLEGRYISF